MQRFLLKTILASFLSLTIFILPVSANSQLTVNNSIRIKQNELSENVKDNQSVEIKVMLNGQETTQITPIVSDKNNKMNITPTVRKIENQTPIESTEKVLPDKSEKQKVTEIKIPTQTLKMKLSPTSVIKTVIEDYKMIFIMNAINNYRKSQKLPGVQTNNETCAFAKTRAIEISKSFSHDGFRSRLKDKSLPYKSWSLVTENIAMTSSYKNVVNMWISSSGHAANMRKDTPYICVENHGNYYAYEGMRP